MQLHLVIKNVALKNIVFIEKHKRVKSVQPKQVQFER